MNDGLWQDKVDLAAALRLAVRCQFHEGIDNHFTYGLPGRQDRYFLHPYGLHWSEIRASDIMVVDEAGLVVEGEGIAETSAVCIHGPVHRAHPEGRCVLHTHMPYATALAMIEGGRLEPASQTALMYYDDVAYDPDYSGLADTVAEGERLAGIMGDKRVLLMANHGALKLIGDNMAAATKVQLRAELPTSAVAFFTAMKRLLDRDDPGYLQ
jgi:ribulose-5-phosphate 4-epimerase/fuculose-1-phosphate aldolase